MRIFSLRIFGLYILLVLFAACGSVNDALVLQEFKLLELKEIGMLDIPGNLHAMLFEKYRDKVYAMDIKSRTIYKYRIIDGQWKLLKKKAIPTGKGPGEAISIRGFSVSDKEELVFSDQGTKTICIFDAALNHVESNRLDVDAYYIGGWKQQVCIGNGKVIIALAPFEADKELIIYNTYTGKIETKFGRTVVIEHEKKPVRSYLKMIGTMTKGNRYLYRMTFEPALYAYDNYDKAKPIDIAGHMAKYGFRLVAPLKTNITKFRDNVIYEQRTLDFITDTSKPAIINLDYSRHRILITLLSGNELCDKQYRIEHPDIAADKLNKIWFYDNYRFVLYGDSGDARLFEIKKGR